MSAHSLGGRGGKISRGSLITLMCGLISLPLKTGGLSKVEDKMKVMTASVLVSQRRLCWRCRLGGWLLSAELHLLILHPEICQARVDIPKI